MLKQILKKKILVLVYLLECFIASSGLAENAFYNDRERGWYYHESFKKLETLEKPNKSNKPKLSLREMDGDQVLSTLASVQKEMQVRQARYTLEPTLENARDFLD